MGAGSGAAEASRRRRFERRARETVPLFEVDAALIEDVHPDLADWARRNIHVELVTLEEGRSMPPFSRAEGRGPGFGLLVLEGVLTRTVVVHGKSVVDLYTAGDLLHPWSLQAEFPSVPAEASWRIVERTKLAVLDGYFAERVGPLPHVGRELQFRAGRRSDRELLMRGLAQSPLKLRILTFLWLLSDQVGKVTREGRVLPLRLSHATLGELVGARRTSVTSAMGELSDRGEVVRRPGGGWLLRGDPRATSEDPNVG